MYNTGIAGYLASASNPNRTIDTKVVLRSTTDVTLTTEDIVSYKIPYSAVAGKYFTPGNFVATPLELTLNAFSTAVSRFGFKTNPIHSLSVEAGIQVDSMVYIPMGVFYVDTDGISTADDGYVVINATDLPPVLSEVFNSDILELPCTIQEALDIIADHIGIPIYASQDDFPNLAVTLSDTFALSTSYREALRYIAEVLGAFVHMGRDGSICIEKVFKGAVNLGCVLDDNYLYSVSQQESMVKPFQYISIRASESDLGVTQEVTDVDTEKEYVILNNPLTYGHPEEFLTGLVNPTSFTAFSPAKIAFHGRPDLDLGDVLEYAYKGTTYWLPVCLHTFEYNGGFKTTVEGIGTDSSETSSHNSNNATTDITALRQTVNSLIRDLTKTQSDLVDINGDVTKMSTLLQDVENIKTQLTEIDGDLKEISTLTQTANQLRLDIESVNEALEENNALTNEHQATLLTYFDFQADGLTIGLNTSSVKLKLINNRIQFLKDGIEVAYLSEGQLFVTDAQFIKSLVLGNFEFAPRTNGNLSLRRR